jgi:hypothetical protein
MFTCPECGNEFKKQQSLAAHLRYCSGEASAAVARERYSGECPVCHLKLPFTTMAHDYPQTICAQCLTCFNRVTGDMIEPPPEECLAERIGRPCPNPAHKRYREQWVQGSLV